MTSPSSPSVQVTSVTRAPSAAYLAMVAPVPIDSSSGCACTSSRLRSNRVSLSWRGEARPGAGIALREDSTHTSPDALPPGEEPLARPGAPSRRQAAARAGMIGSMTESFPRQQARTRRFTLGVPRAFEVSPDGARVTFLRSRAGDDPVTCLWEADAATGQERIVADPRALGADEENLPPEERARRERVRETAAGIVAYTTDAAATLAVFALSGQVYTVPLGATFATGATPAVRLLPARTPALDPRIDPTGTKVGYVHDGALRVIDLESGQDAVIAQEEGVTFGLPEFVAAEEMDRSRGYWWSPDGRQLLVARVDESPVARWHIADPANPGTAPVEVRYPAAGTANADVSLLVATLPGAAATREDAARIARTPLAVVPPAGARLTEVAGWD